MGEHGPHVGWRFFEFFYKVKCILGVNKNIISHYLQFVQDLFWVCVFVMILVYSCHVFVIKSFCIHIVHTLCFCF
jgi:hypothetical protein